MKMSSVPSRWRSLFGLLRLSPHASLLRQNGQQRTCCRMCRQAQCGAFDECLRQTFVPMRETSTPTTSHYSTCASSATRRSGERFIAALDRSNTARLPVAASCCMRCVPNEQARSTARPALCFRALARVVDYVRASAGSALLTAGVAGLCSARSARERCAATICLF